jgi:hypothetical protein
MDVSDLRRRILRALDDARKEAAARRGTVDEARRAYAGFLESIAVPLLRQAAIILRAEGHHFTVETPAETARLAADGAPNTFLEFALRLDGPRPQVLLRVSLTRGRHGVILEEKDVGGSKPIAELSEDDVAGLLATEVSKLVVTRSS